MYTVHSFAFYEILLQVVTNRGPWFIHFQETGSTVTCGMEMQPMQLQPPGRQPTLESQRSDHDYHQPITQSSHSSQYSLIPTRVRRATGNHQENNDVDRALTRAANKHEVGNRFMKEYAEISHRRGIPLSTIFDLFVRGPLATSDAEASQFVER